MNLDGVLFFPVTPYAANGEVDAALLKDHLASRVEHAPGAVFAGCVTGVPRVVRGRHRHCGVGGDLGGRTSVFGGTGGPLRHAIGCANSAADAGAEGPARAAAVPGERQGRRAGAARFRRWATPVLRRGAALELAEDVRGLGLDFARA
jgi:hypothetical protein